MKDLESVNVGVLYLRISRTLSLNLILCKFHSLSFFSTMSVVYTFWFKAQWWDLSESWFLRLDLQHQRTREPTISSRDAHPCLFLPGSWMELSKVPLHWQCPLPEGPSLGDLVPAPWLLYTAVRVVEPKPWALKPVSPKSSSIVTTLAFSFLSSPSGDFSFLWGPLDI